MSPLKKGKNGTNVTIPRLELSGVLLLADLVKIVETKLNIGFRNTFLWTDSQEVLDWLMILGKINKLTGTNCPFWSIVADFVHFG